MADDNKTPISKIEQILQGMGNAMSATSFLTRFHEQGNNTNLSSKLKPKRFAFKHKHLTCVFHSKFD